MIGKYFSNGWKNWSKFSNDWKKFSRIFQPLENFFRPRNPPDRAQPGEGNPLFPPGPFRGQNRLERGWGETTWTTRDNSFQGLTQSSPSPPSVREERERVVTSIWETSAPASPKRKECISPVGARAARPRGFGTANSIQTFHARRHGWEPHPRKFRDGCSEGAAQLPGVRHPAAPSGKGSRRRGGRLWKTLVFSLVFSHPSASRAGRPRPRHGFPFFDCRPRAGDYGAGGDVV